MGVWQRGQENREVMYCSVALYLQVEQSLES